jgi:hypothetical protein
LRGSPALAVLVIILACGRADRERAQDEIKLHAQLASMREAIAVFTKANGHGPATLSETIHAVPVDPLTHSATTWRLTTEERVIVEDFTTGPSTPKRVEILDVHSGAPGRDGRGRAYSEY